MITSMHYEFSLNLRHRIVQIETRDVQQFRTLRRCYAHCCMHQSVTSGRCTTMKRSLLAVIIAATAAPALAEPIDATTPCSVAIQAFSSDKRAGEVLAGAPSQEVLEVGNYILNIMDQLDRQRLNAGEQGIWSNFSDAGKHAIVGSAVANCHLHPRQTIDEAADAVYLSVRDVNIQLGIVK
jgi:hypothetical protein